MRGQIFKASIICIGIAAIWPGSTLAQTPDRGAPGWSDFHLGMTLADALKLKGFSWNQTPTFGGKDVVSKNAVQAFASEYRVRLFFSAEGNLGNVTLSHNGAESREACEESYQKLLRNLESSYGAFCLKEMDGSVYRVPNSQSLYDVYNMVAHDQGVTRVGWSANIRKDNDTDVRPGMIEYEGGAPTKTSLGEVNRGCVLEIQFRRASIEF